MPPPPCPALPGSRWVEVEGREQEGVSVPPVPLEEISKEKRISVFPVAARNQSPAGPSAAAAEPRWSPEARAAGNPGSGGSSHCTLVLVLALLRR